MTSEAADRSPIPRFPAGSPLTDGPGTELPSSARATFAVSATKRANGWELSADIGGQPLLHTVSSIDNIAAVEVEVATIIAYRLGAPTDSFDLRILVDSQRTAT